MAEIKVPVQSPAKRIRNFEEVLLGLDKRDAVEHAKLYLEREGASQGEPCPFGTDIFGFVRLLAKGDINGAFQVIASVNPFPSISGRMLNEPFEQIKVFDKSGFWVSARQLERFVGDQVDLKRNVQFPKNQTKQKVAIIGSGPAGLAAAVGLAQKGHQVVVFETLPKPGGVWRYGYPEFRLPQKIVDRQIEYVLAHGVEIKCNQFIGSSTTPDDLLKQGYSAVYLATGAGLSKPLNITGDHLPGTIYGEDFLMKHRFMAGEASSFNLVSAGDNVVVIGSGNAAFDCARICVRLGAKVTVIAKGTKDDLAVKPLVVTHAEEEGVNIEVLSSTVQILPNEEGRVKAVRCRRYDYADTNQNGEWHLVEVPNSDFEIPASVVIIAIGHRANHLVIKNSPNIKTKKDGRIATVKDVSTDVRGVFAGGNVVDGAGPFHTAVLSSRKAVEEIDQFLKG